VTSWFDEALALDHRMTERLVWTFDQLSRGARLSTILLTEKAIEREEIEWA
jgi:hypothetical protein